MATRVGYLVSPPDQPIITGAISTNLAEYEVDYATPRAVDLPPIGAAGRVATFPVASYSASRGGYSAISYFDDFYNRIYVIPATLSLGNITNAQVSQVEVWNAWLEPRTLQAVTVVDGDGITVAGLVTTPATVLALRNMLWDVTVSTEGAAVLDATVTWDFDVGSGNLAITANRIVPWVVPPDWANGVRERLEWLTDPLRSRTGVARKRQLRLAPRRGFDFDVIAEGRERRVLDALLFDWSARVWALPIWHDVQTLGGAVPMGATSISCRTAGFDFVDGGIAMLWTAVSTYEVVEVEAVGADGLILKRATTRAWARGARLYPIRIAWLQEWPQESAWTDAAGTRQVSFDVAEPCDWTAVSPAALYRGIPVLEWRPDESEDPTSRYDRQVDRIDTDTGAVETIDWPGVAFRHASHRWVLGNRSEHSDMRGLLYHLRGQIAELWVPSWASDLQLVEAVAAAATVLVVDWCGYTRFGRQQSNRRDIRIELFNGTVLYRRIVGSAETTETEQLAIDAALGIDVTAGQVRVISFMTLSEQASDAIELRHTTDADGVTVVATAFRGIKHDQ